MNNTIRLLERVRQTVPRQSKNALAEAIGVERSNLRRFYRGKGFPNGISQIEIARILNMDLKDVVAYIAEDKAKSDVAKKAVRAHIPRLLAAIPLALVGIVAQTNIDETIGMTWSAAAHYSKQHAEDFARHPIM